MTKGLQNPQSARENPWTQVQGFPHRNHSSMAVKPQEKVRQDSSGLGRFLFRVAVRRVGAAPAAAPAPLSVPDCAHSCRSGSQDKDHRYNNVTHMCRQICQHCVHLSFRIRSALWSVRLPAQSGYPLPAVPLSAASCTLLSCLRISFY